MKDAACINATKPNAVYDSRRKLSIKSRIKELCYNRILPICILWTVLCITAFTSGRTNLSPFTKGCRERDASMWLFEFLGEPWAPNLLEVCVNLRPLAEIDITWRAGNKARGGADPGKVLKICLFRGPRGADTGERHICSPYTFHMEHQWKNQFGRTGLSGLSKLKV